MKLQQIKDDKLLNSFSQLTEKHLSVRFPIAYLKRSKVVVLMDEDSTIYGGYAIVLKPPFRVMTSLPGEIRRKDAFLRNLDLTTVSEVTGLWLSPDLHDKWVILKFWLSLYYNLVTLDRTYLIYAYSLSKPKLGRIYSVVKPRILFRGLTNKLPGMKEAEDESVEIVPLKNVRITPFLKPQFFLKKLIFKRRLSRNSSYNQMLGTHDLSQSES